MFVYFFDYKARVHVTLARDSISLHGDIMRSSAEKLYYFYVFGIVFFPS